MCSRLIFVALGPRRGAGGMEGKLTPIQHMMNIEPRHTFAQEDISSTVEI